MQWQCNICLELAHELAQAKFNSIPGLKAFSESFELLREAASEIGSGRNEEDWSARLLQLMNTAHIGMREAKTSSDLTSWRSIYTDSCILRGLVQSNLNHPLAAILTLDHAIIISGPCGAGRLDLILDIIKKLQSHLSSSTTHAAGLPPSEPAPVFLQPQQDEIPSISSPSFIAFQSTFSKSPFIVRNYASNWPALKDHAWKSARYLRSIAGPGRVIPVEIGHDYRSTDWKQELVDWDGFLGTLDLEDQCSFQPDKRHLYLAQHDLTKQFPALRDDIIIPDYVYASLCSDDWPDYHPPNNDEQIILNAWLGPKDATSPAHIDPYYNCYVQVVGYKSVWLAPPTVSSSMYAFNPGTTENASSEEHFPSSKLGNTSQVNVFSKVEELEQYPRFLQQVIPNALVATLAPGDMLFFPPGWWHAMKSETTSFSLSVWF